jgi:hypothetical protein
LPKSAKADSRLFRFDKSQSRLTLEPFDIECVAQPVCGHPPSLEKPPDLDPFFDDLTRAKSAKELKEDLETRVVELFC